MSTVPVFAPDGSLGDIPYEHLHAAIAAGAKPGVTIKAPDGSIGVVPADHYQEAVKAGGQVIPFGQDISQHASEHPMMPKTEEGIETATKDISDRLSDRYAPAMQMALGMGVGTRPAEAARQAEVPQTTTPQPTQAAPSPFNAKQETLRANWQARGGGVADAPIDRMQMQRPEVKPEDPHNWNQIKSRLEELRKPVDDIVDKTLPPDFDRGANLMTKARIDHHLAQGDVEGAQAVLDQAKTSSPRSALRDAMDKLDDGKGSEPIRPTVKNGDLYEYKNGQFLKNGKVLDRGEDIADAVDILERQPHQPLIEGQASFREPQKSLNAAQAPNVPRGTFPPEASKVVPSVQNIRETDAQVQAAEAQPRRYGSADAAEDRALGQEMNWNLERHGYQAESEARREFIARNSTGMTKGELNRQFDAAAGKPPAPEKPVKYTKTPSAKAVDANDDLLEKLQQSLEDARAKRR